MFRKALSRSSVLVAGLLLALLFLSTIVIVRQGQRILKLEMSLEHSPGAKLPAGSELGPIQVRDITVKVHSLEFRNTQSRGTVLYIFRPECVWCQRNGPDVAFLASHVTSKYNFVGLSLAKDGLEDFIHREDMKFPVYTGVKASDWTAYRLGSTPETIVLSAEGTVITSWIGSYTREPIRSEVERFFTLRLPIAVQSSLVN